MDNFGTLQFLLVEDFETMRSVIRGLLKRCGANRVDTAASADEATRMISKNRYDVVLCDYNLGSGKNGQMLLEEARAKRWVTPSNVWIMITAEKNSDMVSVAAEHAPDDYLLKPITEGTLQARLQRLTARKSALAEIVTAMQGQDYPKALSLCKQRLAEGKHAGDLLRLKAQLLELTGDHEQASLTYREVLTRAEVPWAKLGVARLKLRGGDTEGASAMMESIVNAHPQYLEAYDGLAKLLERQGEVERQVDVLQRAARVSPNSATRQTALGSAALRGGQHELAAQSFQRSIKLGEHSAIKQAVPLLGLARVQAETGQPLVALVTLAAVERDFFDTETRLLAKSGVLRAQIKCGNTDAAMMVAQEVLELSMTSSEPVSTDAAFEVAETLMACGQRDVATSLLQFVARNNHDDQSVAERAQRVFESGGMGSEGRELLLASRKQAADAMGEGVKLLSQGKLPEALASMRQARVLMPHNSRVQLNLAYVAIVCLEKMGWDLDLAADARAAIITAEGFSPGNARAAELHVRLQKVAPAH